MRGTVMDAAEGNREFIAGLSAQRAWLHVTQMMRIGWLATADEARLAHDITEVLAVPVPSGRGNREDAFVNTGRGSLI